MNKEKLFEQSRQKMIAHHKDSHSVWCCGYQAANTAKKRRVPAGLWFALGFVIVASLTLASVSHGTIINVYGKAFDIPSKYKATVVTDRANKCIARNLSKMQTGKAVDLLPLACVQAAIDGVDLQD